MFHTFYYLILILLTGVQCLNNCQVKSKCQSPVQCHNSTGICYCLQNDKQLRNGVCLESLNVNKKCLIYRSCAYGQCLTRDHILINLATILVNTRSLANAEHKEWKELAFCNYRVIGKGCSGDRECSTFVANSQCRSGVCTCNQTHYHLDDTCLQRKSYDDFCSDNSECISNLYCRSSQCKCRKNYVFDGDARVCQSRPPSADTNDITLWDDVAKVSGFVIFGVVMLFLCTKKDGELQNESLNGSHRRRSTSSRAHRHRSSSINSHRPLTQTSSNASRSSAYRTFEEPVPIRQTIIIPSPAQLIRSLSSSSDDVDYNPYQFDTLFPQQSDNDDPPSYEDVVKTDSR